MMKYICEACGVQYAPSEGPPSRCAVCEDERQYVSWAGQRWATHEGLARRLAGRVEDEGGLLALGLAPAFAIDQRAFVLPTGAGNIMWEALSVVTDAAAAAINARGGIDRIVVSHPHFYASMGEYSDAFGGAPILLHEADRQWVQCPHPAIEFWGGDELALSDDVTLIRCGGHFAGSTALHWKGEGRPCGALFSGDALQVVPDRRHVSFMYSYPNLIPMRPRDVRAMRERLARYEFEDVFGYTWGRTIIGGGRQAVDRSFERYLAAVAE